MGSYMIKAVLSNPQHPEYGQVTIPFPIPNEEYDRDMELLKEMELGDVLRRDCQVDEVDSYYGVLKRLEGQSVNVDELDYLAKRLESFCVGEDAQFQGMAAKLDIFDITDFINLTFCCQQATVITDFSDLKKVGQDHYMNLHGGCASTEELENLDGYETALLLIDSGAGQVAPYGVVYDNGMKLEQLYDGRHFPGYLYEPPVLALEAASIHGKVTGVLCLPAADQQLQRLKVRAEADSPDTWLRVSMDELPEKVAEALDLEHLSGDDIAGLNRLCQVIGPMKETDMEKLNAVVLLADTSGMPQSTASPSADALRLERELTLSLNRGETGELVKAMALAVAAESYASLADPIPAHRMERLRHRLQSGPADAPLLAELLDVAVKGIHLGKGPEVALELVNGATVQSHREEASA